MIFGYEAKRGEEPVQNTLSEQREYSLHVRHVLRGCERKEVNVYLNCLKVVGRLCARSNVQVLPFNLDEVELNEDPELQQKQEDLAKYCHDVHISKGFSLSTTC